MFVPLLWSHPDLGADGLNRLQSSSYEEAFIEVFVFLDIRAFLEKIFLKVLS